MAEADLCRPPPLCPPIRMRESPAWRSQAGGDARVARLASRKSTTRHSGHANSYRKRAREYRVMLIFVISQHVSLQPLSVPKTRPSGGPNSGTSVGSPDCSRLRSLLFTTAYEQNACNFRTQTQAFTTARLTIQFDVTGTEHDAITTLDMNYTELTCLRGQRVLIGR